MSRSKKDGCDPTRQAPGVAAINRDGDPVRASKQLTFSFPSHHKETSPCSSLGNLDTEIGGDMPGRNILEIMNYGRQFPLILLALSLRTKGCQPKSLAGESL